MGAEPQLSVIVLCPGDAEAPGDLLWSAMVRASPAVELIVVAERARARRARTLAHQASREDQRIGVHEYEGDARAAVMRAIDRARAPYIVLAEPNGVLIEEGYAEAVRRLDASHADVAVGAAIDRFRPDKGASRALDGAVDRDVALANLEEAPGLIGDDLLGSKVYRRGFLRTVLSRRDSWDARALAAQSLDLASSIEVCSQPLFWDAGRTGDGRPRPGSHAWARSVEEAVSALGPRGAHVRECHARAILTQELFADGAIDALARGNDFSGCARVIRALAGALESTSLANLPITHRWVLALLALEQGDLALSVLHGRTRDIGPGDVGPFDDALLASSVWSVLGLGTRDARFAFLQEFIDSRASQSAGDTAGSASSDHVDVSVVIPTYNVAPFIDETLDSILAAEDVSLEVVIVDDGSSDGTWDRLTRRSADDPRVRIFRSIGAGGGQARNFGVAQTRGEYIAFADGDDIVPPRAYARMLSAARRTGAEVVCGGYVKFFAMSTWNASKSFNQAYTVGVDAVTIDDHPQLIRHRAVWSRLIRREYWVDVTFPFPGVPRSNDIVPMVSALLVARSITVTPLPVYVYRDRPGSGSMTSAAGSLDYSVSYFSEEATCAALVAQHASHAVAREYWEMVLNSDGWGNLRKFLDHSRGRADEEAVISPYVASLISKVPWEMFAELDPERQAVWILSATGRCTSARALLATLQPDPRVTSEQLVAAVSAVAEHDIVPTRTLSRLVVKHILPRLGAHYATGRKPTSTALRGLRELMALREVPMPVLVWQEGASAARLVRGKGGGSAVREVGKPVDGRVRSGAWWARLAIGPMAHASGLVRVVARPYGTRSDADMTVSIGRVRSGQGCVLRVPSTLLPQRGAWSLEVQVETDLGVQRHAVRLDEVQRRIFPGRLQITYVAHPRSDRSALRVRDPLTARVMSQLRR